MSAFVGESIGVWDAVNTTGTPVAAWEDIAYRAGSSTFTAGDEVALSADMGSSILVAGDTTGVTISWAIVVLSGTGTFSGSESGDIAGGGSLGSVSVTGAGTYLLPSTVTVADILGNGDADLALECTSGTVVVQQVKLRVWPTGGVVGGYSEPWQHADYQLTVSAWSGSAFTATLGIDDITGATGPAVVSDIQTYLRGQIAADTVGSAVFVDTTTPATLDFTAAAREYLSASPPASSLLSVDAVGVAYAHHPGGPRGAEIDPPGFFGTDWTYPPDEVVNDPDVWDVTGPDAWDWWQGQATLRLLAEDTVVAGNANVAVGYVDDYADPGTSWATIATAPDVSVNGPAGTPWVTFDLPPAQPDGYVRFVLWHDGAFAEQEITNEVPDGGDPPGTTYYTGNTRATLAPGVQVDQEDTLDRISYRYTPAPFRYWVPGVLTKLRQLHRDDGKGGTPPRAFGGASRIRTGRAYGYD